jgi:transcriptional regulator with XRE-family HTH domain
VDGAEAINKRFGVELRRIRSEAGLSVRGLARICGRSPSWVTRLEQGEREAGLVSIVHLARALHVDVAELVRKQH